MEKGRPKCQIYYKPHEISMCSECNGYFCQCEFKDHECKKETLLVRCHSCGGKHETEHMDSDAKIYCRFCLCNIVTLICLCEECGKEFSPWNERLSCDDCQFIPCKKCSKKFPDEFYTGICCECE